MGNRRDGPRKKTTIFLGAALLLGAFCQLIRYSSAQPFTLDTPSGPQALLFDSLLLITGFSLIALMLRSSLARRSFRGSSIRTRSLKRARPSVNLDAPTLPQQLICTQSFINQMTRELASICNRLRDARSLPHQTQHLDASIDQTADLLRLSQQFERKMRAEEETEMTALDLNDVLRTEIEIQKGSLEDEHQVEVSVKLHSSPAAFFGRYRDISQMFALLLDAALQAMDGRHKKQLSITTTMTENAIGFDLTFTRKPPPIHDGSNAYAPLPLNVSGWPKDLDDGSGLALSQIIVKQYGGRIAVLNSEESHSTISVRWPLPKNEARLDRAS